MGNCCGPSHQPFEPQIEDKQYQEAGNIFQFIISISD